MKICITSEGPTLEARVDPRFGRCQWFIFFDVDADQFEAQENANAHFQGGAGIQAGQFIVSRGVQTVLTGNVGPNAHQVLFSAGIKVLTGVSGTVREAVEGYRNGQYQEADVPSVGSKFGMPKR